MSLREVRYRVRSGDYEFEELFLTVDEAKRYREYLTQDLSDWAGLKIYRVEVVTTETEVGE